MEKHNSIICIKVEDEVATLNRDGHEFKINIEGLKERINNLQKRNINTDVERAALEELNRRRESYL